MLNNNRQYLQAKKLLKMVEQIPAYTNDREVLRHTILQCVESLNDVRHLEPKSPSDIRSESTLFDLVENLIAMLTPRELMELFPFEKVYDGQKCLAKDYFSTVPDLSRLDLDTPIGDEVDYLQWGFLNAAYCIRNAKQKGTAGDVCLKANDRDSVRDRPAEKSDEFSDEWWKVPMGNASSFLQRTGADFSSGLSLQH